MIEQNPEDCSRADEYHPRTNIQNIFLPLTNIQQLSNMNNNLSLMRFLLYVVIFLHILFDHQEVSKLCNSFETAIFILSWIYFLKE